MELEKRVESLEERIKDLEGKGICDVFQAELPQEEAERLACIDGMVDRVKCLVVTMQLFLHTARSLIKTLEGRLDE